MPHAEYTDPSGYYSKFGVIGYHNIGKYGKSTINGTDTPVKVFVIDTGLKYTGDGNTRSPDTATLIQITEPGATAGYGGGDNQPHGGFTAALIAAPVNGGNGGIVGIAPDATVYLADVDNADGNLYNGTITAAIWDAINRNVDIISISLGGTYNDPDMQAAITAAVNAGILVFAAAGNDGRNMYEWPGACNGAICVGSCNANGNGISSFSTVNNKVALFAPGEDWQLPYQTDASGTEAIALEDGTSFSTPFCAGLAALILAEARETASNPTLRLSRADMITQLNQKMGTSALLAQLPTTTSLNSGSGGLFDITAGCCGGTGTMSLATSSSYFIIGVIIAILVIAGIIYLSMKYSKTSKIRSSPPTFRSPRIQSSRPSMYYY